MMIKQNEKKINSIVISGINIKSGGPLTVFRDLLDSFKEINFSKDTKITILVNNKDLFQDYLRDYDMLEFPKSSNSIVHRIYYEYIYFYFYSRNKGIDLWISLNDKSPRVVSKHQVVYCHNASMFYKCSIKEALLNYKFFLYTILYKYLYKINIRSNDYVIVQQKWIKEKFKKAFRLDNIIIFPPQHPSKQIVSKTEDFDRDKTLFLYPSAPRVFKNFEVIFEAAKNLNTKYDNYEILITISKDDNRYTNYLSKRFENVKNVKLIGYQEREKLELLYKKSNCLIFPSKLETWGLPLSEFRKYDKPIIVSDLEYAHESLEGYSKALFFNPLDSIELSKLIESVILNSPKYNSGKKISKEDDIVVEGWKDIIEIFS